MRRFSLLGLPVSVLLLWGGIFLSALVLPSAQTGVFASPDETAVAVSITQIRQTGSAAFPEPLAPSLPWLHPRSYVAAGEALLPVGFLGWSWWLAQLNRCIPFTILTWIASLLAVSGTIPWYFLLRKRFGASAAWWGTALAWTFPSVLLYTNRSFFSHLPQYSAILWSLWILGVLVREGARERKNHFFQLLAGGLLGIALSFRPIEAIWILPIYALVWTRFALVLWRKQAFVGLGIFLGLLPLWFIQYATYGSWFQVGYWIQANVDPSTIVIQQAVASMTARPWYLLLAPYGIHPRTILWNVQSFFGLFLLPWAIAFGLACLYTFFQGRGRAWKQQLFAYKTPILVIGFLVGWLLLIYGSGFYTDHVRLGAVTVANSFLRYTLPFGFLFAWFSAWVYSTFLPTQRSLRVGFSVIGIMLIGVGMYTAFVRDEEGVLATRRELVRYAAIRTAATKAFQASDLLLSERSDKIFFPRMRVATPLPDSEQIQALAQISSSTSLGLFSRPLSFSDRDAWRRMGYDVRELQIFGRERLYRLTPFLR